MFLAAAFLFLLFSESLQVSLPLDDTPGSAALDNVPLIDGHNDLPFNLYNILRNKICNFSFDRDLRGDPLFGTSRCSSCHTDLPRIRKGKLGAQFWVAYVDCTRTCYNKTVARSFEQIDVIKRLIAKYPDEMEFVTTAEGIVTAFQNNKLASLIGLEGGHSIDDYLFLLRIFYDVGVRYVTLTHNCHLNWADAYKVDLSKHLVKFNLTEFGKKVVLEMNRLGMMVDLSHVSHNVMLDVLQVSKAPVIFSHSSAYAVHPHYRNVQDDVLRKVKDNGGIVMAIFYNDFIAKGNATSLDVIKHIEHIADVAGVDHVGIGADYDGVPSVPHGLEDVSKYPDLFDLLKTFNPTRWTIKNLEKLAGRNFLRVFKQVEKIRDDLQNILPDESLIPIEDVKKRSNSKIHLAGVSTIVFLIAFLLLI